MTHTIRKKLKRYEIELQPRFLTFSCYKRLPLFSNDRIKDLFIDRLSAARDRYCFSLISWVVMPEHIHLIIIPQLPQSTVSQVLKFLKQSVSKRVLQHWKDVKAPILDRVRCSENHFRFWQAGGGYDRNLRDEDELREKIDYIHANPVTRGLTLSPNDWNWSSSKWYSGIRDGQLPIDPWES